MFSINVAVIGKEVGGKRGRVVEGGGERGGKTSCFSTGFGFRCNIQVEDNRNKSPVILATEAKDSLHDFSCYVKVFEKYPSPLPHLLINLTFDHVFP